jgi:hypothetical protein
MDTQRYLAAIKPAMDVVVKKGEDYNNKTNVHDYFPLGDASYFQMLFVKVMRLKSLINKNGRPNFDSKLDTVIDLINYAVFYAEYLQSLEKADE